MLSMLLMHKGRGTSSTTLRWKNELKVKKSDGIASALASSEKRPQEGNWDRKIFQVIQKVDLW